MSLEDRLAVQELNFLYAYHIDSFRIDEWVGVFTQDAFFDESEFGNGHFKGHEEIRAYGLQLADTVLHVVHLMNNQLIFDLEPTFARGTVFSLCEAMMKTGERTRHQVKYEDEYIKIGGSWKIAKRVLRSSFPVELVSSV